MERIVLCINNGNTYMEETKKYLGSHNCKLYTWSEEKQDIGTLTAENERTEGRIDLLLLGINDQIPEDGTIGENHDCEELLSVISGQINRTQKAIEAALPLLRKGDYKRIGLLTRKDSSISNCKDNSNYGRYMAWAGLNMMGKLYFNRLRPEGFRFRWYCAEENSGGM